MSKPILFNLVEYEKILSILKEVDKELKNKDERDFVIALNKVNHTMNSSEHIKLDEDRLTGWEEGSIFCDQAVYQKELEFEILRPITRRHIMCFKDCLHELENGQNMNAFAEIIDCFFDYGRSAVKKYLSYSEYYFFETLIEISIPKFKSCIEN